MNLESAKIRYCAISMELAAYLDDRYVEMHILTDTGKTISIVCKEDSIFAIQRNIEKLAGDCPEIATWRAAEDIEARGGDACGSYKPATPAREQETPRGRLSSLV